MHLRRCFALLAVLSCLIASPAWAQSTWVGAAGGDFFDGNNWSPVGVPTDVDLAIVNTGSSEANPIVLNGSGTIAGFDLGSDAAGSGHIAMTGGTLILDFDFFGSYTTHIGNNGTALSTFKMTGGSQIDMGDVGFGGFENDFEVGENGPGALSLTDNGTRLRINDDLKIGANSVGNGSVKLGTPGGSDAPEIFVGSGTSLGVGEFILSANSLFVSGNDSGLYDPSGVQDEGYLTFGFNPAEPSTMLIQDSARAYIRTLQSREDSGTLTIKDNGEFHIQETLASGAGGTVTHTTRDSHWGARPNGGVERVITIQDNGIMTVDTNLATSTDSGLSLGGGDNGAVGGEARLIVRDNGSLSVVQGLQVANGTTATSDVTLQVRGGDATIDIFGDLSFDFDVPTLSELPGTGTLLAQFDGATHTSIQVGGIVYLGANSELELEAVSPLGAGGTHFRTLIDGVMDAGFSSGIFNVIPAIDTDLGSGVLFKGITYNANSVVVELFQEALALPGDGNGDGWVDGIDYLLWAAHFGDDPADPVGPAGGDYNNDAKVDGLDYLVWASNFGTHESTSVPEPGSLVLSCLALASLFVTGRWRR